MLLNASFYFPESASHKTGVHDETASKPGRMFTLDPRVEVVLETQRLFHLFQTQTVPVQLGEIQYDCMIDVEAIHPCQFFIKEETGVCDRTFPALLQHELTFFIHPEDFLFLHELRDFFRVGKQMRMPVNSEFSFHTPMLFAKTVKNQRVANAYSPAVHTV